MRSSGRIDTRLTNARAGKFRHELKRGVDCGSREAQGGSVRIGLKASRRSDGLDSRGDAELIQEYTNLVRVHGVHDDHEAWTNIP